MVPRKRATRIPDPNWHRVGVLSVSLLAAIPLRAQTASAPYQLTVFAQGIVGQYTQPDSIAALGSRIFIGYGDGVAKDGSDGASSTIVEYRVDGSKVQTFSVKGHNDGLKVNPATGQLWALQNEDGNPSLAIINPDSGAQTVYGFDPTAHGGGYDDIVFRGDTFFLSASNPSSNPNTAPALVSAQLQGNLVKVSSVLLGNATVFDLPTKLPVALNLQDPDSMILAPNGDIILDSQDDAELVIVQHPGEAAQKAFHLPFSSGGVTTKVDDTVFATASDGFLLVSDLDANTVYRVDQPYWANGAAYSAGISNSVGLVGQLDFGTGNLTTIVSGLKNPRGMGFIPSQAGTGQGASIAANTQGFWFFSPDSIDLTVKVLDGRAINGKFWVFYGSLTNAAFTLTVTDTVTGAAKIYTNPQGTMASAADTTAF
jgi:hypothetical protein